VCCCRRPCFDSVVCLFFCVLRVWFDSVQLEQALRDN
jgi:hypothetical protein